ncbi:cytochrome c oxidase subunit II [Haloarchaeobius amylolyticus]|uniref:cytochrome c oxidase subunit II n=1 Tax=Haloarchaeobius amylolyticus TaxID=1198296 RepID=UPI00226E5610|nr:cytochrome c oxidase subunit II [Haloarchaeobius amylolyticus]
MNAKRLAPTALLGAAFLLLLADPVAAQASTTEEAIRGLNEKLLVVAIPITVLVEGVLIYTVLKYRKNDEAKPTRENRRLEITWTVATAVILLFVGLSATMTMANPAVITDDVNDRADVPQDAEHVQVTAETYAWTFTYDKHNVSSSNKLVIPKGQETYFNVTTKDWLHAVHVPGLGLKQDAVPGQHHYIMTEATTEGTYQGYCAEYCGVGHSGMMFEVEVMSQEDYQDWLKSQCEDAGGSWDAGSQTCTAGNSSSGSGSVAAA